MSDPTGRLGGVGKGQLEREAAQWCVKMHGPDAELHRPAFETWLRLGALHRSAYNRIDEVYVLSGRLGAARPSDAPAAAETRTSPRRVPVAALAGAAALILSGILLLSFLPHGAEPISETHALERQAVRLMADATIQRFRLSDGSVVALEPGSALLVSFSKETRNLRLVSGRGDFEVAHEDRPFIVAAASGRVRARGTRFVVAVNRAAIDVKLIAGRIDVTFAAGPDGSEVVRHLTAGQVLRYPAERSAAPPGSAWARQPTTVGELVDRANAIAGGSVRLEVADRELRTVVISGTFAVHDPITTADRLAAILDLDVDRPRPGIISLTTHPR